MWKALDWYFFIMHCIFMYVCISVNSCNISQAKYKEIEGGSRCFIIYIIITNQCDKNGTMK